MGEMPEGTRKLTKKELKTFDKAYTKNFNEKTKLKYLKELNSPYLRTCKLKLFLKKIKEEVIYLLPSVGIFIIAAIAWTIIFYTIFLITKDVRKSILSTTFLFVISRNKTIDIDFSNIKPFLKISEKDNNFLADTKTQLNQIISTVLTMLGIYITTIILYTLIANIVLRIDYCNPTHFSYSAKLCAIQKIKEGFENSDDIFSDVHNYYDTGSYYR